MKKLELTNEEKFFKILETNDDVPNYLCFLSKNTRDNFLKKTFSTKKQIISSLKNNDFLKKLWKCLLIDAIHFLRINDSRERAFWIDPASVGEASNKTQMTTTGSDTFAILSAYGIEDLYAYYDQFTKFESILYGSDKYYRDHIQHPLRVWIIGLHVIKDHGKDFHLRAGNIIVVDEKDAISSLNVNTSKEQENKYPLYLSIAELSAMWTIIALTHDLGYPLEKVERINDQLEKMLNQYGKIGFTKSGFSFQVQHDHLVRMLMNIISSTLMWRNNSSDTSNWSTHRRPKYLAKFSKSWEMFDHGIVSSLILLKSLTFFLESDITLDQDKLLNREDARQFSIRSEILHSIASHTAPKIYHLSANTLPFLLILCDDLQEWGRPTLTDIRAGDPIGNNEDVTIEIKELSKEQSEIYCRIEYIEPVKYEEQEGHAKRIFKNWHERLRPAADDKKRNMKFTWDLVFNNESFKTPWRYELDTKRTIFLQVDITRPNPKDPSQSIPFQLYS